MLLVFPALAAQRATVELYRGASLAAPGYWAVEDAYLDKAEPTEDHGGGFTLLGGKDRTILIRFGDLARVVGPNRRVVSAVLVLTPSGGDVPKLTAVTAVDAPWGEGPWSSLSRIIANLESGAKAGKAGAARGAATWTERRAGIAPWPNPGAPGGTAVETEAGAKEKTFEITGLGSVVQGWVSRPWTDHGLALSFEGDVEFFSSQSPSGRPRLVLTTEPIAQIDVAQPDLAVVAITQAGGKWTARVRNVGAAGAPAAKATWWADGKALPEVDLKALAPGAETTVAYGGSEPANDPQVPTLALAVAAKGDAEPGNDRLDVFPGGKPVSLRLKPGLDPQAAILYWNETVAPGSRFSFAPEGAKTRVRLESVETAAADGAGSLPEALRQIGRAVGLPEAKEGGDLYPGLMGYGDTRFEGTIPGKLALPYEPYPDPPTATSLLEPTGLLSATDVGRLNDMGGALPLPRTVLVQALDLSDRPLPGLQLRIEGPGSATTTLVTGPEGAAILPVALVNGFKSDLSNGTLSLRATLNGRTATGVIKAWRLSDAHRRSGSQVVVVNVHLDLPMQPLETETNLAQGKAAFDSQGSEAAKLAPLVDGDPTTAVALPAAPGGWVEIDLGRDRTIGEIALRPGPGAFWNQYEVRVYATGGRREDATLWASELDEGWALRNRGEGGWLTYRTPAQRIRYVRIVSKAGGPASLAEVRVVPVKLAGG